MELVTTSEVKALVNTTLSDLELDTIIDREEAELVRRFGANAATAVTVVETRPGGTKSLYLTRGVGSITSVVEYIYLGDTVGQTLTANTDYVLWAEQGRLERLYGNWGPRTVVTYTPVNTNTLRAQVLIELVRIAIDQTSFQQESFQGFEDSYSYVATQRDWQGAREAQYARLSMGPL